MNPVPGFDFTVMFLQQFASAGAPITRVDDVVNLAGGLQQANSQAPLIMSFAEVTGLNAELEIEEYREGGNNFAPRKFPRWGRFSTISCRRGVTASTDLWDWYRRVQFAPPPTIERRNGFVLVNAHGTPGGQTAANVSPIAAWFFQNALPERLIGPSLNARGNEIAIESLEISHEGLLRIRKSQMQFQGTIPGIEGD